MCLAQGPQRNDACEARTRGLLVSSQALYHWATVLPSVHLPFKGCWLVFFIFTQILIGYSVSKQWRLWSDATLVASDLGLHCFPMSLKKDEKHNIWVNKQNQKINSFFNFRNTYHVKWQIYPILKTV